MGLKVVQVEFIKRLRYGVGRVFPYLDDASVALVVGQEALAELACRSLWTLLLGFGKHFGFSLGHGNVLKADGDGAAVE